MLIKLYEDGVKKNESKLLEKADDDVTKFVRRVQASHGVRVATASGEPATNGPSPNNQCDCGRAGLCDRSSKDCKQAGTQGKESVSSFPYDSAK